MTDSEGRTDQIPLTKTQRRRIETIKQTVSDPHTPEPSDQQILSSLLDTWDAVDDGHYGDTAQEEILKAAIPGSGLRTQPGTHIGREEVDDGE